MLDELLASPGVREWLATNQPDWRPEFESLVEERLAEFESPLAEEDDSTAKKKAD